MQIRSFPDRFLFTTIELTHFVGSFTFTLTPCYSIRSSSCWTPSTAGIFLGGWMTGVKFLSSLMWYGSEMRPKLSKLVEYLLKISSLLSCVKFFPSPLDRSWTVLTWNDTSFNAFRSSQPRSNFPWLTMWNRRTLVVPLCLDFKKRILSIGMLCPPKTFCYLSHWSDTMKQAQWEHSGIIITQFITHDAQQWAEFQKQLKLKIP